MALTETHKSNIKTTIKKCLRHKFKNYTLFKCCGNGFLCKWKRDNSQ